VGEWRHRLGPDLPRVHGRLQPVTDQAEAVDGLDLPPGPPPKDRRSVDQPDPLHRRIGGQIREGHAPESQLLRGVRPGGGGVRDPLGDVAFHLLEHRAEQLLLADEVVIPRAPGHPGLTHDVLPGRSGETPRANSARPESSRARRVAADRSACRRRRPGASP
jgi:hypothetical protein